MDRELAKRNLSRGLFLGVMAAAIFALTFLAAGIYIAQ